MLSQQITEGVQGGLPDAVKNIYRDNFKSLVGNQVNAPIGADFVGQRLAGQDLNYRMQMGQLGAGIAQSTPGAQNYAPNNNFNVGGQFGQAFGQQMAGYGSQVDAEKNFALPGKKLWGIMG